MKRLLLILLLSLPLAAQPYHLELEAAPAAVFPYLARFGTVEIHVYASGVRTDALWLNGFSRNGAKTITVANPLGRMYMELPLDGIAPRLARLAGSVEKTAAPVLAPDLKGKVGKVAAVRHRLMYGPDAWIDYWTTTAVPENPQLRAIVQELLAGISPRTAEATRGIRGTPILVELNFRRFKNVRLLKLKRLTFSKDDEEEALELGPLYVRAGVFEKVLGLD